MTRVALSFGAALLALLSLTDARSASAPAAATNGTGAKTIALAPTTAPPPAVSAPDATTQAPAPNIAAPTATTQTMAATAPAASPQVAAAAAATQAPAAAASAPVATTRATAAAAQAPAASTASTATPAAAPAAQAPTAPAYTGPLPTRGMNMQNVEHIFGTPLEKHEAVGKPPITRWDYADYSVFFEYNLVLHTVIKSEPFSDSKAPPGN